MFDFSVVMCSIRRIEHKFENSLQICMTGVAVNLNTLFLKEITLTSLFHGASFLQDHPTTVRVKDASSTSKKNYLSSPNLNYHHSINVMISVLMAPQEQSVTA